MDNAVRKIEIQSLQAIKQHGIFNMRGERIDDLSKKGDSAIKAQGSTDQTTINMATGRKRLGNSGNQAQTAQTPPTDGSQPPKLQQSTSPEAQYKKTLIGFLAATIASAAFGVLLHFKDIFGEATKYLKTVVAFGALLTGTISASLILTRPTNQSQSDMTAAD